MTAAPLILEPEALLEPSIKVYTGKPGQQELLR